MNVLSQIEKIVLEILFNLCKTSESNGNKSTELRKIFDLRSPKLLAHGRYLHFQ